MEKERCLKQFVQEIQNKVSIAVAIVIIRTKPLNKTAEEHAKDVQDCLLSFWKNDEYQSEFENKILYLKKVRILSKLKNIVPNLPEKNITEVHLDDSFCSSFGDINISGIVATQDSKVDTSFELENAEFIRALVCLKFGVDSHELLPLSTIQACTKNIFRQNNEEKEQVTCVSLVDSGYNSYKTNNGELSSDVNTVFSSLFRRITHCKDTGILLEKSIHCLLKYIHQQITFNPIECLNNWQGSVLEHMWGILKEAASDSVCFEPILGFITEMFESIWDSDEIDKHWVWEIQCLRLSELCCTSELCSHILDFLFEKINELIKTIEEMKLENFSNLYKIEKGPHFLEVISHLLRKLKRFKKKQKEDFQEGGDLESVTNLWKSKLRCQKVDNGENTERNVNVWKRCLEKLICVSSKDYPLITFQTWAIVQNLESENKTLTDMSR